MQVSDWLIKSLTDLKIQHVFFVAGGEIDPLVISMGKQSKLQPILACHEEGAGFMADGYARIFQESIGISMTIGAPGAGNSLPAALAASADRSSILFLTGGSPVKWMGLASFQESDEDGTCDAQFFAPTVRFSQTVAEESTLPHILEDALKHMRTNFPGPVHVSIPTDIQTSKTTLTDSLTLPERIRTVDFARANAVAKDSLSKARKIVLLIGRGAQLSEARDYLLDFIETFQIPFTTTFSAKGYLPEDHPLALGMFGYAGHKRAIETLIDEQIDMVLILGSSLNQRDTLFWDKALGKNKFLIQVDCDSTMIGRNYPVNESILADIKTLFQYWNEEKETILKGLTSTTEDRKKWNEHILQKIPLFYEEKNLSPDQTPIHPTRVLATMNKVLPDDTLLFIDSGAHRAFAGHYWFCKGKRSICSATRIGPMGWAIPASIGGKLAAPHRPVVTITGDGCMRMHGIEIATAVRYKLPIIFVVSNNNALGNVYLRMLKENPGAAELTTLTYIDWVTFAQSLGATGIRVEDPQKLEEAFQKALHAKAPFVIDIATDPKALTPVAPFQEAKDLFLHDSL